MKSQNDTNIKNKPVVISGERKVRRGKREVGIKRYKLLCIKKLQGCIVPQWEYSQYFIIIINRVQPLKTVNHYDVYL